MMMHATGGNVFQVEVPNVLRQPAYRRRWLVADAIEMADVEVQGDGRRIDVLHQFQKLIGLLDQEVRLRLNEQENALRFGVLRDRLEHLDKEPKRCRPRRSRLHWPAR